MGRSTIVFFWFNFFSDRYALHTRASSGFFCCLIVSFLILFNPSPSYALQDGYEKLKSKLNEHAPTDQDLINSLPEPETAEEFYLLSQTRDRVPDALSDLKESIERSDSSNDTALRSWINLALLTEPESDRLEFLRSKIEDAAGNLSYRIWLLAGKYAAYADRFDLASRWAKKCLDTPARASALLDLAEYAIKRGDDEKSRDYLDRHLIEYPNHDRSRHWTLAGQRANSAQSDSEAYIAYSHVIKNYPESLELKESERKLANLPLPEPLRPGHRKKDVATTATGVGESDTSSQVSHGDWKVQLGSFTSRDRAEKFVERMNKKVTGDIGISQATVDGREYFRVQIRGFKSKFEAQQKKDKLVKKKVEAFILDD